MTINWIDHVVVPVKSLDEASAAYERLGLKLTPVTRHKGLGTENRVFMVGDGTNDFYLELLGVHDRAASLATGRGALYQQAMDAGLGIARLMLGSDDVVATVAALKAKGFDTAVEAVSREDGTKICDVAPLEPVAALGLTAGVVQYTQGRAEAHERRARDGRFDHSFPLKRLDHLAAMAPRLEETTAAWREALGVAVTGEVRGPGMIIKQLKIGDATLELLGPDSPESPMASRPPGLASMCAWEVPDLDDAVALARERGFTPSDPRNGILPGTRVSTIPAAELANVGMQLLEYV
jgi:catechol 2,3-dioxygenase-like lactoylglutathione lyase family enzyme